MRRVFYTALSAVIIVGVASPLITFASNTNWSQDTTLYLSSPGISLTILSGSDSESLSVAATTFTVNVGLGDTFTIRYPGPSAGTLANDGGLDSCELVGSNNEVTVTGPDIVIFTPNTTLCGTAAVTPPTSSGGGGGGPSLGPAVVSMIRPNGGEIVTAGAATHILYSVTGGGVNTVRISLSTNGGLTYTTLADNLANLGVYTWNVTSTPTFSARIRVEAKSASTVLATAVSRANFTIQTASGTTSISFAPLPNVLGTILTESYPPVPYSSLEVAAPQVDPTILGPYTPVAALGATPSIDVDKGIFPPSTNQNLPCIGGSLVKIPNLSSVYYCGKNGKRYVFINEHVFFSWFSDFSSVQTIAPSQMASIPIGGNVTYRPGMRMVKIQTDPKVYALARGGILRWVKTEAVARSLYGPKWNEIIDDVPDSFFFNFKIGEPIE